VSLPLLLDGIESLPAFARLLNLLPSSGGSVAVSGLSGSADAAVVAALSRRLTQRFVVVLTDTVPDAERWLADLNALTSDERVGFYPPREAFGEVEPHAEIAGERVETLEKIATGRVRLLVTTARAVLERTRLPDALRQGRIELRRGDVRRPADLAEHLEAFGFERVDMVDDVGQFSVRGGIFDIYGFGMAEPVRLEFWGDEIAELRHFDLVTQRSTREAAIALVLPVEAQATSRAGPLQRIAVHELWPPDSIVILPLHARPEEEMQRTWEEAHHHIDVARRRGEDVPDRDELFQPPDATIAALNAFVRVRTDEPESDATRFPFAKPEEIGRDIRRLRHIVRDGIPTMILCDNAGQAERLEELLNEGEVTASPAALVIAVLHGGFVLPPRAPHSAGLRVLTDHEIFRRERRIRRARRYASAAVAELATALQPGDYVVHLEHGVGIYRGLERTFVRESTVEVAVIEYEGGDRLQVPLYRIDQLERYRAAGDGDAESAAPRLHRLGGKRWKQQRDKTRAAIREMTAELLDLYARRRIATRPPHGPDTPWQRQLESSFLFEDTPDQRSATVDVKHDMEQQRPMDRLLIGDVGYGKTEIAVRAAFKTVQSGRQVAVLVPTTILADQHVRTFSERLADFPVLVRALSRFQTQKEQDAVIADLAAKRVDIVIGTHRLLSRDVQFADLGLIIVDEEHRFGVRHKERLKQLRLETDVLTLTATPIPRTLHLSLAGLRDMTLIQTPPRDRSPVLTFLEPWDDEMIAEGVFRELDRGGQVFFVHNRIETIEAVADHLRRVLPRARISVAHGQMRERDLEDVMHRFVGQEVDVLVSTMIVESGLDVPNANTMFVNRADTFGLAQLYQLRGRVGRSHRRAYCYLMVPDSVDDEAERRLRVLEHHTELGAGYRIALKDLEMRGAGNLLGPEQSGFVQAVGFDMYLRLLNDTVTRMVRGDGAVKIVPADVSLDTPAYLPDEYIGSPEAKLDIYRRLTTISEIAGVEELRTEVRDRFGPLPPAAEGFFTVALLRVIGGALEVQSILVRGNEARVSFHAHAVPRMRGLSAAFHEVQFATDVRRTHPLSLKLTRLGGLTITDGLLRALESLRS
jgi:transcription-repair coupling factor (superfamily II helicase)